MNLSIEPSGDQCLIVQFGTIIDIQTNRQACAFARRLEAAALPGVVDIVPSFTGVGVHYQAAEVLRLNNESPVDGLRRQVVTLLESPLDSQEGDRRVVEIPVCYGGEYGPDLEEVASVAGLTVDEIVQRHTSTAGHIFMLGFAPGHPFIGLWDQSFAVPRRQTPRTKVPAGSVAIANRQSTVYPFDLPGGWNLIGRTPLQMFDLSLREPARLRAGDEVRFVSITADEFAAIQSRSQQ